MRSTSEANQLTVPKFDTTLGTLTAVSFSFKVTGYASRGTFLWNPSLYSSVILEHKIAFSLVDGTGTPRQLTNGTGITDRDKLLILTNNGSSSTWSDRAFEGTVLPLVIISDLDTLSYLVGNDAQIDFITSEIYSLTLEGNTITRLRGSTSWSGQLVTTYTYVAVPEPSTLSLLVAGFSLLAIAIKKRRY